VYPEYLNDVLCFLIAAIAVVLIFMRMSVSPVLGYLVAGIIIGPYGIGFVDDIEETKSLAEFGVLFLLFTIALELSFQRLKVLSQYVFGFGFLQVSCTGLVGTWCAVLVGIPLSTAALIGVILSLSSTAMVLQILSERGELTARFGRVAFSILLFQDLAVVLLLVILSLATGKQGSIVVSLSLALFKAVVVLSAIILSGRVILRPIYRWVALSGNPELFMATTLLVVFGTSLATAAAGLSMALGAFLAGLLLAETEYRHQIEADIEPFRGLLLGLFFMTVGMSVDLSVLAHNAAKVLSIVGLMVLLKSFIIIGISRFFTLGWGVGIQIGLLLSTGGEFAFVLLSPSITARLLDDSARDILYAVVAVSMTLTPFLGNLGRRIAKIIAKPKNEITQIPLEETGDLKNHVIIAGFGRVGQLIATLLHHHHIPYVAIDMKMVRISEGRAKGFQVFFGDARRAEVIRALGGERARVCVITLDHEPSSLRSVTAIKRASFFKNMCPG
jgi:CPA2 family monovalent cation:H+ antiporter-2